MRINENNNHASPGLGGFIKLLRLTKPAKWLLIVAIGLSLVEAVAGLIVPLFTKSLIDQFSESGVTADSVRWLAGVFILQTLTGGFSYYLMTYIGESFVSKLRSKVWNHVLELKIPYFDKHESGELMSRAVGRKVRREAVED